MSLIVRLFQGGLGSLAAYLAAHVLLCLVPAFFIAGGLSALVPKETITRFLGRATPKFISYPAALLAGSVLAVCSCTIVPLFAGIYKKGAGIGPAITFLFFAPAANILALSYTGVALGAELAIARLVLSLVFGISIGLIMALIFRKSDEARDIQTDQAFAAQRDMPRIHLVFLLLLVALLIAGTLKLPLLTSTYSQVGVPGAAWHDLQTTFDQLVPFDPAKGEEGLSVQGALLIFLLGLIGLSAWKGFENILEGFNPWTYLCLGLVTLTLLFASLGIQATPQGLVFSLTGRTLAVGLLLLALFLVARARMQTRYLQEWLWESWRFVKQIFPLLIVGVFAVGVIRQVIRPEWIEALAGENTVVGNLAGVLFGVFMYFPTLVEVPVAKMFLSLGMHPGPLLAYLMADPELSLQSILITAAIIGRLKAWVYVGWVALFSTLAGLAYGAWVDGTSLLALGLIISGFALLLGLILWLVTRRGKKTPTLSHVAPGEG